jgi:hypothetical protein
LLEQGLANVSGKVRGQGFTQRLLEIGFGGVVLLAPSIGSDNFSQIPPSRPTCA